MGQAGRQAVSEKFAVERLVHDIESLYGELNHRSADLQSAP
jgi:hypothetical protein